MLRVDLLSSELAVGCCQVHQLLGKYTEHTGENFEGSEPQYEMLQKLAKSYCGYEIPIPMLKKM